MSSIPGWLELAAINSPQSVTVAGDPDALEKLVQAMTAAGKFARVSATELSVPYQSDGTHSRGLLTALKIWLRMHQPFRFISTVDGVEKAGQDWMRNIGIETCANRFVSTMPSASF